jgi:hypothetical protein
MSAIEWRYSLSVNSRKETTGSSAFAAEAGVVNSGPQMQLRTKRQGAAYFLFMTVP